MKKIIFCIDGNIGSGKSTVLNNFSMDNYTTFMEPLNKWDHALELFYSNMHKHSFNLQAIIFKYFDKLYKNIPNYSIIERSHHTTRYIFTEYLYNNNFLTDQEFKKLDKIYNDICNKHFKIKIISIYIDTDPTTCSQRIIERKRHFEKNIPISYLEEMKRLYNILHKNNFWINGNKTKKKVYKSIIKTIIEQQNQKNHH